MILQVDTPPTTGFRFSSAFTTSEGHQDAPELDVKFLTTAATKLRGALILKKNNGETTEKNNFSTVWGVWFSCFCSFFGCLDEKNCMRFELEKNNL